MNTEDDKQDTVQSSAYNPFPEPQTIPSGWDTSEFVSNPRAVPVEGLDGVAEHKSN
jgi:hypothetical protein